MKEADLADFISLADKKITSLYGVEDHEKDAYMRLAKFVEETGELAAEVLKQYGRQHKSKLNSVAKEDLENEFADVIITVLLLAKSLNVDINTSLEHKIEKIRKKLDI